MIPILYESTEMAFASNGLGRLRDCITCKVTEERNGIYECDFEYPVDGAHFNEITVGRIIAVEHDDTNDVQPFDIVGYTRPIDGIVEFHCVHVSYRQSKLVTDAAAVGVNTVRSAFNVLRYPVNTSTMVESPFTYQTDITDQRYIPCFDRIPKSVRSVLGGIEGSILDTFGGEYEWDKFNVILHSRRGVDRDFTIRYGFNMSEYNEEVDDSDTYMRVYPYWTDGTKTLQGSVQEYGKTITNRGETIALDVSDRFESEPTVADINAMGLSILKERNAALPVQTIHVEFVRLSDTEEYKEYASLQRCKLCDTVKVIFPSYKTQGRFKIVKTVYDVLLDRFESMELGDLSTTLSEALGLNESDPKASQQAVTKSLTSSDITASMGTFTSGIVTKLGRMVFLTITFKNANSTASGIDVFRATLNDSELIPTHQATGGTYYGNHAFNCLLSSAGNIYVRNASDSAVTISGDNTSTFSLTYIV